MRTAVLAGAVTLSLLGTGCATKKYVAKTVAPVEAKADAANAKNVEQDKQIASQGTEIQELDRDLSSTKERLTDVDNKANQANVAAKAADQKADGAQQSANNAQQAADGARNGVDRLTKTIDGMNKFTMAKQDVVLFPVNSWRLNDDAKQSLTDLAKQAQGLDRYVIEVQGFTDKTGSPAYNDRLSQERAESVARFLTVEYKIPVRNITMLGEGWAEPVAADNTRAGRKQNRRVEVRLWVPETGSTATAAGGGAQ